jgi:hypothetical protein
MPFPIADLPLAVLDHKIRPFLDYEGRIALNAQLPPNERRGTPLVAEAVIKFGLRLATLPAGKLLRAVQKSSTINTRAAAMLKLFQQFPSYSTMTQHLAGFRASYLGRIQVFADANNPDYGSTAAPLKRAIVALATAQLATFQQTYPFKTEIALGAEQLDFLEGAAPHHVVDNALHVATVQAMLAASQHAQNFRHYRSCYDEEADEDAYWEYRDAEEEAYEAYMARRADDLFLRYD